MFKELMKRQLIEDIISFRFLINTVVILSTVILFTLIFIKNYHNLLDEYSKSIMYNEDTLVSFSKSPNSHLGSTFLSCLMKPKPELFISEAHEGTMPQGFLFSPQPYSIRDIKQEKEVMYTNISQRDLVGAAFSFYPDLTFIVQFLLGFFAIVLTFNAVSAEKEKGTLRLIYSNSFKSGYFVLAKYLAAFLTVFLPLLLGLILSLILLAALLPGAFYSALVLNFLSFLILSLLYISIFILLGLLLSILSQNSKTSLVLCLLSWIFLVIIIPKATGILLNSKQFDVPTEEEINEMGDKAVKSTMDRIRKQFPDDYARGLDADRKIEMKLKMNHEVDKSIQDISDFYLRKKLSAIKTIRAVNFISPASLFEFSASSFAGTGLSHFEGVWIRTKQYGSDFIAFLKEDTSILRKGSYFYPADESVSDKPIDASLIPRFEDKTAKPGERINNALPFISILILYNLLLFVIVIYKFQRYDVR